MNGSIEPAEVGLLRHHGPELFPVVDLIIGGGLPVAAALFLGRLRTASARLTGGSAEPASVQPGPEEVQPVGSTPARIVESRGRVLGRE